jgi:hypothetical protein
MGNIPSIYFHSFFLNFKKVNFYYISLKQISTLYF